MVLSAGADGTWEMRPTGSVQTRALFYAATLYVPIPARVGVSEGFPHPPVISFESQVELTPHLINVPHLGNSE